MIRGLDASSVQGALPFDKLGADCRFVILKAQQGNDGFDPWFHRNATEAAKRGLHVFAYCFPYPLPHLDPREQANLFVEKVPKGMRLFLDFEWPEVVPSKPGSKGWKEWGCSPAQIAAWAQACTEEVERLSGMRPAIYTYDWWWSAVRDGAPAYGFPGKGVVEWAARFPLWMAHYRSGWPKPGDAPKIPKPWRAWAFWQFDGNGGLRLPNGVDSDFCVFNGDEEALAAFARGEDPPEPCPPPPELNTTRGLQERLAELGFDPGPIDGASGPKTRAAIVAFQTARGLAPDGIVGPKTREALLAG